MTARVETAEGHPALTGYWRVRVRRIPPFWASARAERLLPDGNTAITWTMCDAEGESMHDVGKDEKTGADIVRINQVMGMQADVIEERPAVMNLHYAQLQVLQKKDRVVEGGAR